MSSIQVKRAFGGLIQEFKITYVMEDITPEVDLFSCGEGEVKIKTNKGYECKDFIEDAEEVQKTMLKNLNITSSRINFDNIMAPKQISTNCWFN